MRGAAGSADRFPLGGGSAGRILTSCSFPLSVDLIPVLSRIRRGDAEAHGQHSHGPADE